MTATAVSFTRAARMSSSSRRTAASSPAVFLASAMPCSHCLARAPSSMPRSWPAGKIACPTSEHSTPLRQLQPGEPLRLVLRSNGVQWGRSATTSADARKQKLELLLRRHNHPYVRYSEAFKNAEQLLAECRVRGLEGIVSKKKQAPYELGKCDLIKVKCAQWKEENRNRGELFAR